MKTTTLLATPTSPVLNKTGITENLNGLSGKNVLRHAIKAVLMGSVLVSGMASAQLLDHGPGNATLVWPDWYRDNSGMAVGLCLSKSPMCFPTPQAPLPAFVGNVGPEIFYNLVEFKDTLGAGAAAGLQFHYMAALESSYIPGDIRHGDEVVFSRIRISLNFPDALGPDGTHNMEGTYKVTHPFGVATFEGVVASGTTNATGNKASVFNTVDIPIGTPGDFNSALSGPMGPWITDVNMPAGGFAGPAGFTTERFVADPTLPVSFQGSPFGTNFLRIEGPLGSNLDGLGNDFIQIDTANVLGQIWTAPIAQPLTVTDAYVTRSTKNALDVWATSSPLQKLIMTAAGSQMPSLQMYPDGLTPTKYHGHVEFPKGQTVPASVMVSNVSSIPLVSKTLGVVDWVDISKATFDTASRTITVVATSSDAIGLPTLTVQGIDGTTVTAGTPPVIGTSTMTTAQCPAGIIAPTVCYTGTLPAQFEPPVSIAVQSSSSGTATKPVLSLVGAGENPANPPVATNYTTVALRFPVSTNGVQELVNSGATALPLNAIILTQPITGTVALNAGKWFYTPSLLAAPNANDTFTYIIQDPTSLAVSSVANVKLVVSFKASAPSTVADTFAVQSGLLKKLFVLANDKPASANAQDAIKASSVAIVKASTKGTSVANIDGSVSYTAAVTKAVAADAFNYTATNSATPTTASTSTPVILSVFPSAEVIGGLTTANATYTRASDKWSVKGTTSWFNANLTATTATCWTGTGTTPTAITLIGSVLVDSVGGFTIVASGTAKVPATGTTIAIRCSTGNGALGAGTAGLK